MVVLIFSTEDILNYLTFLKYIMEANGMLDMQKRKMNIFGIVIKIVAGED